MPGWPQAMTEQMTRNRTCLVVAGVCIAGVATLVAQAPPECAAWNTEEYFQTATVEDVTACLDAGADPNAPYERRGAKYPVLYLALTHNNLEAGEILLAAGADPNAAFEYQVHTLVHNVVYEDRQTMLNFVVLNVGENVGQIDLAAVGILLEAGADPNVRNSSGNAAIHGATSRESHSLPLVEALLAAGADVNLRDAADNTPLHLASGSNAGAAVIQALLSAGADLSARDGYGKTPLHDAADRARDPAVVDVLIAAGSDANARDNRGQTPLHSAVLYFQPNPREVMGSLLAAGADPDARDDGGRTPLFAAVAGVNFGFSRGGQVDPRLAALLAPKIEVLLAVGADPLAETSDGQTPWSRVQEIEALAGSDAYRLLNAARVRRRMEPPPDSGRRAG